jgi:hypothetical protein
MRVESDSSFLLKKKKYKERGGGRENSYHFFFQLDNTQIRNKGKTCSSEFGKIIRQYKTEQNNVYEVDYIFKPRPILQFLYNESSPL